MAPPPPATPTPHRFLVPKRSQQSRNSTPKAFQTSSHGQQFQATPRFSLHSTPRAGPPSSSTPGPVFRQRNSSSKTAVSVHDIVDSSPPSLGEGEGEVEDGLGEDGRYGGADVDVIEESSPLHEPEGDGNYGASDDVDGLDTRTPKRRRVSSASSGLGIEESSQLESDQDILMRDDDDENDALDIESSLPDHPDLPGGDAEPEADDDDDIDTTTPDPHHHPTDVATAAPGAGGPHQPTFHKAPRFKPAEAPEASTRAEPLPDVFSPHRRGAAKYIPGGLASELRDWLVDVEAAKGAGAGGHRREGEFVARVRVEEVRSALAGGGGMTLVVGRDMRDDDDDDRSEHMGQGKEAGGDTDGARSVRFMLAGPGRLTGLARRNEVGPGAVVGIGRPTWEVELQDLGHWAVACDWVVL
ncbi:Uu.00g099050.m01.CDS01 [Anthostomella pinea]|uniref:Uu.00g099050.m01.CDS01 n=1 Tax=Anthostomella pinea TaxID=933095 RepID=A0AAI8VDQ8_9PEZI|nr:Uu.00g099050.m01.CDS01 [Anthostomella pinea]